jgi:hypothetical protein
MRYQYAEVKGKIVSVLYAMKMDAIVEVQLHAFLASDINGGDCWESKPYLLTYGAEPFLRSRQLCSYSRTSQHFKEPEVSSPCSHEPSTGPYPEPDRSTPSHPISLRSILILSTHLRLGLPSGLFASGFPTNILYK